MQKLGKDDKIILAYEDLKNGSAIDADTFALTRGNTIVLNRFMYDDSEYLRQEYSALEKSGHFVAGTDYRNIVDHEMGHIIAKRDNVFAKRILNAIEKQAKMAHMNINEFVCNYISVCSTGQNEKISEIFSKYSGYKRGITHYIMEEALNFEKKP